MNQVENVTGQPFENVVNNVENFVNNNPTEWNVQNAVTEVEAIDHFVDTTLNVAENY